MKQYLDLVTDVLNNGELRPNRTGIDTLSLFGVQTKYDLRYGFPLLTTKKVNFDSVVRELLWFLSGETNIHKGLRPSRIWDEWADESGEVGPGYGWQWRHWGADYFHPSDAPAWKISDHPWLNDPGIDQIAEAIRLLKSSPSSRRIIVSAWNVADLPRMALPPCHAFFQLSVSTSNSPEGKPYLDCKLYQRSADLALGVPFNIASYALLMHMFAQECGMTPRFLIHTFGDLHIYVNHIEGLKKQISRPPLPLPSLWLAEKPFDNLKFEDIGINNYDHHPYIKFEVAV